MNHWWWKCLEVAGNYVEKIKFEIVKFRFFNGKFGFWILPVYKKKLANLEFQNLTLVPAEQVHIFISNPH